MLRSAIVVNGATRARPGAYEPADIINLKETCNVWKDHCTGERNSPT
jgi:hypothetical protein